LRNKKYLSRSMLMLLSMLLLISGHAMTGNPPSEPCCRECSVVGCETELSCTPDMPECAPPYPVIGHIKCAECTDCDIEVHKCITHYEGVLDELATPTVEPLNVTIDTTAHPLRYMLYTFNPISLSGADGYAASAAYVMERPSGLRHGPSLIYTNLDLSSVSGYVSEPSWDVQTKGCAKGTVNNCSPDDHALLLGWAISHPVGK